MYTRVDLFTTYELSFYTQFLSFPLSFKEKYYQIQTTWIPFDWNLSLQGIGIQSFQDSPYLSWIDNVLEKMKCMATLGQTPPVQDTFLHIKGHADTVIFCF